MKVEDSPEFLTRPKAVGNLLRKEAKSIKSSSGSDGEGKARKGRFLEAGWVFRGGSRAPECNEVKRRRLWKGV